MARVHVTQCDHCLTDDTRSGVGAGNVRAITCIVRSVNTGVKEASVDLCCDCEKELLDAITRWTSPKPG